MRFDVRWTASLTTDATGLRRGNSGVCPVQVGNSAGAPCRRLAWLSCNPQFRQPLCPTKFDPDEWSAQNLTQELLLQAELRHPPGKADYSRQVSRAKLGSYASRETGRPLRFSGSSDVMVPARTRQPKILPLVLHSPVAVYCISARFVTGHSEHRILG